MIERRKKERDSDKRKNFRRKKDGKRLKNQNTIRR